MANIERRAYWAALAVAVIPWCVAAADKKADDVHAETITCRELSVVDDDGKIVTRLDDKRVATRVGVAIFGGSVLIAKEDDLNFKGAFSAFGNSHVTFSEKGKIVAVLENSSGDLGGTLSLSTPKGDSKLELNPSVLSQVENVATGLIGFHKRSKK